VIAAVQLVPMEVFVVCPTMYWCASVYLCAGAVWTHCIPSVTCSWWSSYRIAAALLCCKQSPPVTKPFCFWMLPCNCMPGHAYANLPHVWLPTLVFWRPLFYFMEGVRWQAFVFLLAVPAACYTREACCICRACLSSFLRYTCMQGSRK